MRNGIPSGSCRLLLASLVALGLASAAAADGRPEPHDPRKAHAEADRNKDGKVDRAEFQARMVEVFYFADADKSGFISFEDMDAATVFPEDFRSADRDGDRRISLYEFIEMRFADFREADTDGDGMLSVEEVEKIYHRGREK